MFYPSICAHVEEMVSLGQNILTFCLSLATILILVHIPNTSGLHCFVGVCYPDWQDCSVPSDNFKKVLCRDSTREVCVSKISDMKMDDKRFTTIDGSCGRLKDDFGNGNRSICSVLSKEGLVTANQFIRNERKGTELDDGAIVLGLKDCTCDIDYCNHLKDPLYPHTKMKMKTTTERIQVTIKIKRQHKHLQKRKQVVKHANGQSQKRRKLTESSSSESSSLKASRVRGIIVAVALTTVCIQAL